MAQQCGCIEGRAVQHANRATQKRADRMDGVNRRYFENLMADKKLSLRALAQKMGMQHSQLSLAFSGTRRLQLDEVAQLSHIFGRPLVEVVEAAGVQVKPVASSRVSVVGAVQGDGTITFNRAGDIERTTAPEELGAKAQAVQARTAGTGLDWLDGAVLFYEPGEGVQPAAIGRLSLVQIENGPAVLAAIRRGYVAGTYNLSGLYRAENVKLAWATPILLTRH
jgi:transcriptional regulator with XRE-family HTH domain